MKKFIVLFLHLLIAGNLFAQVEPVNHVVIPLFGPDSLAFGRTKIQIAENSTATVDFIFPNLQVSHYSQTRTSHHRLSASNYSGFLTAIADIDTNSSGHGDGDSLSVSAFPLFYNEDDSAYQEAGNWFTSSGSQQDSIIVVADYDWETGHADNIYSFAKFLEFPPCNGVRLKIYTGSGGQLAIRPQILSTK